MNHLLPNCIRRVYTGNNLQLETEAVAMFLDISGFTEMTEAFLLRGSKEVEVLNDHLNEIFEPLISIITEHGGDVLQFAGDAISAFFPVTEGFPAPQASLCAVTAAEKIRRYIQKQDSELEEKTSIHFSVKIGLAYGAVEYGCIGETKQKVSYFRGTAIDGASDSEHLCGPRDIVIDGKLHRLLSGKIDSSPIKNRPEDLFYRLETVDTICKTPHIQITPQLSQELLAHFFPKSILTQRHIGEFRHVISIFCGFREMAKRQQLEEFSAFIFQKIVAFGGFFDGIFFGDKGAYCHILFGLPKSYEDIIVRACLFAEDMRKEYHKKIRIGMTFGYVYAGFKGGKKRATYGVLGHSVNLAARLMMNARWSDILVSSPVYRIASPNFRFYSRGTIVAKGISEKVAVYALKQKRTTPIHSGDKKTLVGRQKEKQIIRAFIHGLLTGGQSGILYVYGDAGIGKTQLVEHCLSERKGDFARLNVVCDSVIQQGLYPFTRLFSRFFNVPSVKASPKQRKEIFEQSFSALLDDIRPHVVQSRNEEILHELERTKSFIGSLVGIYWPGSLYDKIEPNYRFSNTMQAIEAFFIGISYIQPILITLEDLHWIDTDTLKFFEKFIGKMGERHIGIIAASRYINKRNKPALHQSDAIPVLELELQSLSDEAVYSILTQRFGDEPTQRLFDTILNQTGGNPFYIEQYCNYIFEKQLFEKTLLPETSEQRITLKEEAEAIIPESISLIITSRIDSLSERMQETITLAATLGQEFDVSVLQTMIRLYTKLVHHDEVEDHQNSIRFESQIIHLEPQLKKGSSYHIWRAISEIQYLFSHSLIRDTVYEMQLQSWLQKLHFIAGTALENVYGKGELPVYELAWHFDRAQEMEKAKKYLLCAAEKAEKNYLNEDAIDYYRRLITILNDRPKQLRYKHKLASIYQLVGRVDQTLKLSEELISEGAEINDHIIRGHGYRVKGLVFLNQSNFDKAQFNFNKARDIFQQEDNLEGKSVITGNIALLYILRADFEKAKHFLEEQRDMLQDLNDQKQLTSVQNNLGLVSLHTGNLDEAMTYFVATREAAEAIGDLPTAIIALTNIGNVHRIRGIFYEAQKYYEKALALAREIGAKREICVIVGNLGVAYATQFKIDEAQKCYFERIRLAKELNESVLLISGLSNLVNIYGYTGELQKAIKLFEESWSLASKLNLPKEMINCLLEGGPLFIRFGDFQTAKQKLDLCVSLCERHSDFNHLSETYFNLGLLYSAQKNSKEAHAAFDKAIEIAREREFLNTLHHVLVYKASEHIDCKQYDSAVLLLEKIRTLPIIHESQEYLDMVLFQEARIMKKSSPETALVLLDKLVSRARLEHEKMMYLFEKFLITKDENLRIELCERFDALYSKNPDIAYKERLEQLKNW